MKRLVVALVIMTAGSLPLFGADEADFFISDGGAKASAIRSGRHKNAASEHEATSETGRHHQTLRYTILHFESKVGDICLQPVVGKINGAQLYLSF